MLWETKGMQQKVDVRVKQVIDGNTFETDAGDKVRMANVKVPKKEEEGADKATKDLKEMIEEKHVTVEVKSKDINGRFLADVWYAGKKLT
jgi:endonuclease YncB( thermonuclease family)